jgi:hypothetical protein
VQLVDRSNLRQHDTANYGATLRYRGNPTYRAGSGPTKCMGYDITGLLARAID